MENINPSPAPCKVRLWARSPNTYLESVRLWARSPNTYSESVRLWARSPNTYSESVRLWARSPNTYLESVRLWAPHTQCCGCGSRNEREVTLEKQKIELAKLQLSQLEKEIELQMAKNKALSLNPAAKVEEEKRFETLNRKPQLILAFEKQKIGSGLLI
ncbi:hypothetical protein TNCV_3144811 [Trichonephila clavipes]|nr:hypothetical protein TNCV_3144811 [Trichonephila clavipes]